MTGIPFLFVVFALVALQVLFPRFTRLLKSPFRSGIVSSFAIGFMASLHEQRGAFLLQFVILCPPYILLLIVVCWA